MEITYTGAVLDSSGYAEAARNNIAALHSAGVDVSVVPVSFEGKKAGVGQVGKLLNELIKKVSDTRIQILHVTPHLYPKLIKSGKYNIGYSAWETSLLPSSFVKNINVLDEIWVPSKYNVEVFKTSGVTIPVVCMPHAFDTVGKVGAQAVLENKGKNDFVFYSIFQWLERKNPVGLIKAYLTEFKEGEDVLLVLKTFILTPGSRVEVDQIKRKIQLIKKTLYLSTYPRMLLITTLLNRDQMASLHTECDCYISLLRSEGFGVPIAEAMLAGNPAIATGYSGPVDFVKHEKTGYLVDHMLTPVSDMPWETYRGDAIWAEPDLMQARQFMREAFENREQTKEMGKKAKAWVKRNLSWKVVGEKMRARLEEINGH